MFDNLRNRLNRLQQLRHDAEATKVKARMFALTNNGTGGDRYREQYDMIAREYNKIRFFFQSDLELVGKDAPGYYYEPTIFGVLLRNKKVDSDHVDVV